MTGAISSLSTQSVTQISLALQTSSQSSGLAFTASGATYDGQSIALSDISNDRSGRFTGAEKQQAMQAQGQLDAQRTIAELNQFLPTEPGSNSQGEANGGVEVSISQTALQLLNELNAPNTVQSDVSLSLSVTNDAAATNVTAGADIGMSASTATAQYNAVLNLSAGAVSGS